MPLSRQEEVALNRALLEALRWRLRDKTPEGLPPDGKYYIDALPHDRCAVGSMAHLPNDEDRKAGIEPLPNSMGLSFLVSAPESGPLIIEVDGQFDLEHAYIPSFSDQHERLVRCEGSIQPRQILAVAAKRYTVKFERARFEIPMEALQQQMEAHAPAHNTLQTALGQHLQTVARDERVFRRQASEDPNADPSWVLNWSPSIVDQDSLIALVRATLFDPNSGPLPYALSLSCAVQPAPASMCSSPERQDYLVEVFLSNDTPQAVARAHFLYKHRVMDVQLNTRVLSGTHQRMRYQLEAADYRYEAVQEIDGYGTTCSLAQAKDGSLRTETLPIYEQPRVDSTSPKDAGMHLAPTFDRLGRDPLPVLEDLVLAMRGYAKSWSEQVAALEARDPLIFEAAKGHLADFQDEIKRAAQNIELLRKNAQLRRSFILMNQTMKEAMRVQRKGFDEWHLFQIGFIVTQISEIASRTEPLPDNPPPGFADVLWFPTGGGKTEAYLGLLVVAMFYQRLNKRYYGVTGWLRLPLRALAGQQLQRMEFVIAAANRVRVRVGVPGFAFTLGYYTGFGTPNSVSSTESYAAAFYLPYLASVPEGREPNLEDAKDFCANWGSNAANDETAADPLDPPELAQASARGAEREDYEGFEPVLDTGEAAADESVKDQAKSNPATAEAAAAVGRAGNQGEEAANDDPNLPAGPTPRPWLQWLRFIHTCPHCSSPVQVKIVPENFRIKHVCTNDRCWSHRTIPLARRMFETPGELGLYISDEECYRYIPSILVGTSDKLVIVGHNRNFRQLFGQVSHFCPDHGFIPRSACHHWVVSKTGNEWNEKTECPNRARVSAVRTVRVTPLNDPGIPFIVDDELHLHVEDLGNFYAVYASTLQALQCSFPGGRPPKIWASTATLHEFQRHVHHLYLRQARCFPAAGRGLDESFYARIQRDPVTNKPLTRRLFMGCLPLNTSPRHVAEWVCDANQCYHNLLAETVERLKKRPAETCRALNLSPSQAAAALAHVQRLLSPSLIYVGRMKDAEHVSNRLRTDNIRRKAEGQVARRHVQLDASVPLATTQQIIADIQSGNMQDPLRTVVATPVISHGVHVKQLNMMFLTGLPTTAAEYIQASSRCGRVHSGSVVVGFDANNLFELGAFTHFRVYHLFQERLIEFMPINRLAPNVLVKSLPGICHAVIINWAQRQMWGRGIRTKAGSLSRALSEIGADEALVEMIVRCYGFEEAQALGVYNTLEIEKAREEAVRLASSLVAELRRLRPRFVNDYISVAIAGVYGQGPMISLREVDRKITLMPSAHLDKQLLTALGAPAYAISNHRAFFENFLPGAIAELPKGVYALVVGGHNDVSRSDQVPPSLMREVVIEDVEFWKRSGGEVDEPYNGVKIEVDIDVCVPNLLYLSPFPVQMECTNPECRRVIITARGSRAQRIEKIARLIGPKDRVNCPICKKGQLKQLPFAQVHVCGQLRELEPPRIALSQPLRYDAAGSFFRSRWTNAETGEPVSSALQCQCEDCATRYPNKKGTHMVGAKLRGGRAEPFYPRLVQYIGLTRETTALVNAYRAPTMDSSELGRAVVCGLLDLQDEVALRRNLTEGAGQAGPIATRPASASSTPAKLNERRASLTQQVERVQQMPGMKPMLAVLERQLAEVEQQLAHTRGLFAQAEQYIDDKNFLAQIGASQRAIEAALVRREFRERSLALEAASADPAQQLLLQHVTRVLHRDYGIREVRHLENVSVVLAATGFTRQGVEPNSKSEVPLRLNAFVDEVSEKAPRRLQVYALPMCTEAILLRIDPCRVLRWAVHNLQWEAPPDLVLKDPKAAHAHLLKKAPALVGSPNFIRQLAMSQIEDPVQRQQADWALHLFALLHSLVHAALRTARRGSGYDWSSLMEYLLPADFSALIYVSSTKSSTMRGLETLYHYGLSPWMAQASSSSVSCVFDPVCRQHRGSCLGCIQTPLGCQTFNHSLSRAYLHGGVVREAGSRLVVWRGFWS